MADHLPDRNTMCHRTGFAKSCFECVTQHGCRLWKDLAIDADRETGAVKRSVWGCIDALMHTYMLNLIGRQDTTTASVDSLRKDVRDANDVGMGSALAGINAQLGHMRMRRDEIPNLAPENAPKQLTGDH